MELLKKYFVFIRVRRPRRTLIYGLLTRYINTRLHYRENRGINECFNRYPRGGDPWGSGGGLSAGHKSDR